MSCELLKFVSLSLIKTILSFLGVLYIYIYIYTSGFCQASTSFSKLLSISGMLFVVFIHTFVVLLD
jgi:hypothetical protein